MVALAAVLPRTLLVVGVVAQTRPDAFVVEIPQAGEAWHIGAADVAGNQQGAAVWLEVPGEEALVVADAAAGVGVDVGVDAVVGLHDLQPGTPVAGLEGVRHGTLQGIRPGTLLGPVDHPSHFVACLAVLAGRRQVQRGLVGRHPPELEEHPQPGL